MFFRKPKTFLMYNNYQILFKSLKTEQVLTTFPIIIHALKQKLEYPTNGHKYRPTKNTNQKFYLTIYVNHECWPIKY